MGTCNQDSCSMAGSCSSKEKGDQECLANRMGRISHKIMVLSGKGGVGKSTVATNIAVTLAMEGKKVGILDTDFHGPSIPTLLHLEDQKPKTDGESILPVEYLKGIKVMSIGFLLQSRDDAIIWRGPMKGNVIKQLLTEVEWGDIDYLIVDFPPGTGDEALSVGQLIPDCDGAVIVTTPQDLSLNDVRKCITFCRKLNLPVLGVIENMSGLVCPHCKNVINIFKSGGGEKMAEEVGVPFLGKVPIEPLIVEASDSGKPFVYYHADTEAARVFAQAVRPLLSLPEKKRTVVGPEGDFERARIAVPVTEGRLSGHFGHCEEFVLFDVDLKTKTVQSREKMPPPPHEPGVLPQWLAEKGATMIIAGGMGTRAQGLFTEKGIKVAIGAPSEAPEKVVELYLNGTLELGKNVCDH